MLCFDYIIFCFIDGLQMRNLFWFWYACVKVQQEQQHSKNSKKSGGFEKGHWLNFNSYCKDVRQLLCSTVHKYAWKMWGEYQGL